MRRLAVVVVAVLALAGCGGQVDPGDAPTIVHRGVELECVFWENTYTGSGGSCDWDKWRQDRAFQTGAPAPLNFEDEGN